MAEKKKKKGISHSKKASTDAKAMVDKPEGLTASHEKHAKSVKKPSKASGLTMTRRSGVIRWEAPDYYTFEKSPYWSLLVGVLAVALSLILIYTNNYFPVIIIILAVIVTFQISHERPKAQEFALDEGGVMQRNEYIPYIELKSFWIARHGNKTILYLEPIQLFKSPIVVPLGRQNVTDIRTFILRFLPEQMERGEMLSDKLIRIFRL